MKKTILAFSFAALFLSFTLASSAQTENRTVQIDETWDAVSVAGNHTFNFEIGNAGEPLTIIGHPTDLENLEVFVKNNTLHFKYPKNYHTKGKGVQIYAKNPSLRTVSLAGSGWVYVTGKLDVGDKTFSVAGSGRLDVPDIEGGSVTISLAGSGKVDIGNIEAGDLKLSVAGSGSLKCASVAAERVNAEVAGSGKAEFAGNSASLSASLAGSGKLNAGSLTAAQAHVKVSGSGKVECKCTQKLTASVHGSGKVFYYGRPENVKFSGKTANIVMK